MMRLVSTSDKQEASDNRQIKESKCFCLTKQREREQQASKWMSIKRIKLPG